MTTTAAPTAAATKPLEGNALVEVFNTLKAFAPRRIDGHQMDATPDTKARLRLRLDDYSHQRGMENLVLLVRRYFNTYRGNDWRIVEWQVIAALKLLATVSEELDQEALQRQAATSQRASRIQHGDPRCLTAATDGECVCV